MVAPTAQSASQIERSFDFAARRAELAASLRAAGISDPDVLAAFSAVPRERFVAPELLAFAYEDRPLPIGQDQTISQPQMVAIMLEALELAPTDRLLEVGTGSGYAAALAARLCRSVHTIERLEPLAQAAARRLADLSIGNVVCGTGDGTLGWLTEAPFDAILVSAGGPHLPGTLLDQLAEGGRLVMPVGRNECSQRLVQLRCRPGRTWRHRDLGAVRFVPLIGAGGWPAGPLLEVGTTPG